MINEKIYLKDGTLLANGFERVVHGGRGDYVEIDESQIVCPLVSKFGNDIANDTIDTYYWWLHPKFKPNIKIYLQRKTVKYADYKIGKYYISPNLLRNFQDPEKLF